MGRRARTHETPTGRRGRTVERHFLDCVCVAARGASLSVVECGRRGAGLALRGDCGVRLVDKTVLYASNPRAHRARTMRTYGASPPPRSKALGPAKTHTPRAHRPPRIVRGHGRLPRRRRRHVQPDRQGLHVRPPCGAGLRAADGPMSGARLAQTVLGDTRGGRRALASERGVRLLVCAAWCACRVACRRGRRP